MYNKCFSIFIIVCKSQSYAKNNFLCTFYFSYRSSIAFYIAKTMGVSSNCQWGGFYLSVRGEISSTLYTAFLTGDRMIQALIPGRPHCLPDLGCNAIAFDWGCENLVGSNDKDCAMKVKVWFELLVLLVFLHQIQSLWAVTLVVGSPIKFLFILSPVWQLDGKFDLTTMEKIRSWTDSVSPGTISNQRASVSV